MNSELRKKIDKNKKIIVSVLCFLSILVLPTSQLFAANFTNGESANGIIGQYSNTTSFASPTISFTKGGINNGANKQGFSLPNSAVTDTTNHRLFVSDTINNRVIMYNLTISNTLSDLIPDAVLGQPDYFTNTQGTTATTMNTPQGLAFDEAGQKLFVADQNNNRILIFDVASITDGEAAVNVLGQPDFVTNSHGTTDSTLYYPMADYYDQASGSLFVADMSNNRVLIFDVASITDGEAAINVLGQSNFISNASATSATGMNTPAGIAYDATGNRLFVSELSNSRVIIFDTTTITNGQAAVNVLGQSLFTTNGTDSLSSRMRSPQGISFDSTGNRLFVADSGNNRVLIFDTSSISDGQAATNVLGQSAFSQFNPATTDSGMNYPQSVWFDSLSSLLYIPDSYNNRILIQDVSLITDGQSASGLIGQYSNATDFSSPTISFTKNGENNGPGELGFKSPGYIVLDLVNHRLFLSDTTNNRVLVYNLSASNALTDLIPDNVLGQPDFNSNANGLSDSGMDDPAGLEYDSVGNRLFVSDANNNRVLVFDVTSITDGQAAINVLGQSDFISNASAVTSTGLNSPQDISYNATDHLLYVADANNNRVLVFDVNTITDGESAINVLGQIDFTSSASATTNVGLSYPQGLAFDDRNDRLFVGDTFNNRIMIFSTAGLTDGQAATNELGEPDFTTSSCNVTVDGMCVPKDVYYDSANNRLFIDDNVRVLAFNVDSITDGQPAVNVLGEPDFTTIGTGVVTDASLNVPTGFAYNDSDKVMYVVDTGSHRVLLYSVPALPELQSISSTNSNGTYTISNTINLTATFDEPVDPTSTLTAHLNNGVTVPLTTVSGNTISADYIVGAGEDTPLLNVASISSTLVKNSALFVQTDTTLPPTNLASAKSIAIVTTSGGGGGGGGGGGSSSSNNSSLQKVQRNKPVVTTQPPVQPDLVSKLKASLALLSQSKLSTLNSFCISPNKLTRGAKGLIVKEMQQKLILLGSVLTADGVYGKGTYNAVINFQQKNKLVADGRVGLLTRDSICGKTSTLKSN